MYTVIVVFVILIFMLPTFLIPKLQEHIQKRKAHSTESVILSLIVLLSGLYMIYEILSIQKFSHGQSPHNGVIFIYGLIFIIMAIVWLKKSWDSKYNKKGN
jgi:cytochrome bd-type quinol oxidase subunit 2